MESGRGGGTSRGGSRARAARTVIAAPRRRAWSVSARWFARLARSAKALARSLRFTTRSGAENKRRVPLSAMDPRRARARTRGGGGRRRAAELAPNRRRARLRNVAPRRRNANARNSRRRFARVRAGLVQYAGAGGSGGARRATRDGGGGKESREPRGDARQGGDGRATRRDAAETARGGRATTEYLGSGSRSPPARRALRPSSGGARTRDGGVGIVHPHRFARAPSSPSRASAASPGRASAANQQPDSPSRDRERRVAAVADRRNRDAQTREKITAQAARRGERADVARPRRVRVIAHGTDRRRGRRGGRRRVRDPSALRGVGAARGRNASWAAAKRRSARRTGERRR